MTGVTDGASLRHKRVMDMLLFIKSHDGATIVQIQSYMLTAHGLKFKTTAEYIKECQFAGILRTDGMLFRVVEKKARFEVGFEYVCEKEGLVFLRKRK